MSPFTAEQEDRIRAIFQEPTRSVPRMPMDYAIKADYDADFDDSPVAAKEMLLPFHVVFTMTESTSRGTMNVCFSGRATPDIVRKMTADFAQGVATGVYDVRESEGSAPRSSIVALRFSDVLYIC